ncbi:hypothetical protein [Paenibacillus sp. QZ-Y1]|uniref:hypothetical protein n=1 Tax=Paenibacillus sp. QZ-Y1 TaxID=3414511 RepID=UPI003F7A3736
MNIAFYPYLAVKTLLSLINVIYIMVITTFIYGQTGSILYAALFPCMQITARIVAGLTFPLLVNRIALSRLMISIPAAKTCMITGIAVAFTHLTAHIPVLLFGIAILSLLDGWESRLLNALTPQLVQGEDLAKANSLLSFSTHTATIIGYAMTGFIVVYLGASQTFWAVTTLSWAVLILMVSAICSFGLSRVQRSHHDTMDTNNS